MKLMQFLSNNLPQKTAIQLGDEQISFDQLHNDINQTAQELKKLPQAILILDASPSITFIIQFMAALEIGQPVALFSNQWSHEERKTRIGILGSSMEIDHSTQLTNIHNISSTRHHPELALILFTSGSTGEVKAVQLSKHNIEANCLAVIQALEFSKVDNQLLFLPLSYSFGLLGQLIPGLLSGITSQLITQFTDIKSLLELGQVPQMWSGVPSHWVALSRMAGTYPESAKKVESIISAGAPLTTTLRHELSQSFPNATIFNNYGLTEASPRVLTYSSHDPLFMEDYAGYPIGDWEIKLSEDQELFIKGPQLMLGYLGEHKKTDQEWFATGDLAQILPSGLVAIKGRRDMLVNVGGEKVHLAELEQKISRIEGIKEVVVLPVTDTIYGVRLVAYLEKTTLTEEELTEKIQNQLLPRKLPISVKLLEKIPKTQNGKIDRKALS